MTPGAEIAGPGHGRTLSWRSRNSSESNWWTSALELSSTLASKMDQVPATLAGLSLPWQQQAGAKGDQPKDSTPEEQHQRGSSMPTFTLPWKFNLEASKPVEIPKPLEIEPTLVSKSSPKHAEETTQPRLIGGLNASSPKHAKDTPQPQSIGGLNASSPKHAKETPQPQSNGGLNASSPKHAQETQPAADSHSAPKHVSEEISPQPKPVEHSNLGSKSATEETTSQPMSVDVIDSPTPTQVSKPHLSSPGDVQSVPFRVGESKRQTKRMPVDVADPKPMAEASSPRSVRLSAVSQELLLGDASVMSGSARSQSTLDRLQRHSPNGNNHPDASIRRVDETSGVNSSRRSSHHSSRFLLRGSFSEEAIRCNAAHVLPEPPGSDGVVHVVGSNSLPREQIFPGTTNNMTHLKLGRPVAKSGEVLGRLSKHPVFGGSSRVAQSYDAHNEDVDAHVAPSSLPTSPRNSKESRASKLLRKLRLSGRGGHQVGAELTNIDPKSGKRSNSIGSTGKFAKETGSKVMSNLVVLQQDKFMKSLEPHWKPEISNGIWSDQNGARSSKVSSLGNANNLDVADLNILSGNLEASKAESAISIQPTPISSTTPRAEKQEAGLAVESVEKKSKSRWLFKWKWGSRSTGKGKNSAANVQAPKLVGTISEILQTQDAASPCAEIMSDARDNFGTKSDRYLMGSTENSSSKHKRRSSWGAGFRNRSAPSTPIHQLPVPVQKATKNVIPVALPLPEADDVSQSTNMEGEVFEDCNGSFRSVSFRSIDSPRKSVGSSFRSIDSPSKSVGSSFRSIDSPRKSVGSSFRSIDSPSMGKASYGSFRSVESPSLSSMVAKKRNPSMEEIEWDSRLPPPLPQEQNLTIGDIAALCNSPLKFVFKCREIEHFNKFLRAQRKRLLASLGKGNVDCFSVVLSGTDLEVSSMVAGLCYAWFLENTIPKVTGDTWHAVPVIDIPRHYMHKRKDAAWLFDACGIDAGALLFSDEVELSDMMGEGRIKMTVVGKDVLITKNEVGSVCTLLAEKVLAEAQCLLQPRYMKSLLLAGILLDTENLDFASIRDTEMTTILLVGSGSLGRNGFFNQLRQVVDDEQISKLITRHYGDARDSSHPTAGSKFQELEVDPEHSDKESIFTHSQDQTSSSSLDEESPRLPQQSSFQSSKRMPLSAPARTHRLPSPSGAGCDEDAKAVAHIRQAASQSASPGSGSDLSRGTRSATPTKIRKKLFLYVA